MIRWAAPGTIVAGIILLFWPAMNVFFVGDDFYWIQHARYDMATLSGFLWPFAHTNGSGQFRPLTLDLYFWVCWHLFGMDPLGYHIVELIVYIVTALIIFQLISRLTASTPAAFLGTAFWALSLTHYEGLNWIDAYAETGAILPGVLALSSLVQGRRRWAVFFYVLCLFSNETVSPIPAMATAYFFIFEGPSLARTIRRSIPLWVVFAIYVAARVFIPAMRPVATGPFAVVANPLTWAGLIQQSFLWSLGFLYAFVDVYKYSGAVWHTRAAVIASIYIGSIILLVLWVTARAIRLRGVDSRSVRLVLLGIAWFLIGLTPVLPFARNFAPYNLSLALVGMAVTIAGLAVGVGKWAPAPGAAVLVSYVALNLLSFYGPGGLVTTDGVTRFAQGAYVAYTQMTAYEQLHPGMFTVYIDDNSATFWVLQGNSMAYLVAPGSTVCYAQNWCAKADIVLHYDPVHYTITPVVGTPPAPAKK